MIKIIAVLRSLASPADCHEQTVMTSDFADISLTSCLMGAEWPGQRLAKWRCVIGDDGKRGD